MDSIPSRVPVRILPIIYILAALHLTKESLDQLLTSQNGLGPLKQRLQKFCPGMISDIVWCRCWWLCIPHFFIEKTGYHLNNLPKVL